MSEKNIILAIYPRRQFSSAVDKINVASLNYKEINDKRKSSMRKLMKVGSAWFVITYHQTKVALAT